MALKKLLFLSKKELDKHSKAGTALPVPFHGRFSPFARETNTYGMGSDLT